MSRLQTPPPLAPPTIPPAPHTARAGRRITYDVIAVCALLLSAAFLRLMLPRDGLFYDDAWPAFGAINGSLRNFFVIGQTQPGFTAVLAIWTRIAGTSPAALVMPAKVAGVLGSVAVYVVLRFFRYSRSVAFFIASLLVVSTAHIQLSSRVKPYTADVLVALFLAVAVSRIAYRRWSAWFAVVCILVGTLMSTLTAISSLLVVAAALTLALHPRGDRRVRLVAVGAQLAILALYVVVVTHTYNGAFVERYWKQYGAYIDWSANPASFVHDLVQHAGRAIRAFPGGPQPLRYVVLATVVVGLVLAWRRRPVSVATQFFVIATVLAIGGSVVKRVPFTPLDPAPYSARVALWLIPVIAFGLAEVLQRVRDWTGTVFDALVPVTAVLLLVTALAPAPPYPRGGARDATRHVMSHLATGDAVWITRDTTFSFALAAGVPVHVRATPHEEVGFVPAFDDPRLHVLTYDSSNKELRDSAANAQRVWVVLPPSGYESPKYRFRLDRMLLLLGFERRDVVTLHGSIVEQWNRRTP